MFIRKYDANSLISGDVVEDFLVSYLGLTRHGNTVEIAVNESMSAEAALTLQTVQLERFQGQDDVVLVERNRWRKKVLKADRSISGFARPKLLAEIADYIDCASKDLLWLRDQYGVLFDDLDYACISDRPVREFRSDWISDVFEINAERLSALESHMTEARTMTWIKQFAKLFRRS